MYVFESYIGIPQNKSDILMASFESSGFRGRKQRVEIGCCVREDHFVLCGVPQI